MVAYASHRDDLDYFEAAEARALKRWLDKNSIDVMED